MRKYLIIIVLLFFSLLHVRAQSQTEMSVITTDVLIIGGGASGTMAGIQAARMGVSAIIVEETPWLGGMLTAAGVSAIDGNYRLHSGLWEEFRQLLYLYYGGANAVKTGWVSNVLFEPKVGEEILSQLTDAEKNLTVLREARLENIQKTNKRWETIILQSGKKYKINARIVIDATELGDVAKQVGIAYDIGMDSRSETGESIAPEQANNIIQDLTYTVILKDYGALVDATIPQPDGYDPSPFLCTCAGKCDGDKLGRKLWECDFMMKYGKLPNGYYMINWPISGNDFYLNVIEMSRKERQIALQKAKDFTLNYLYYLQTDLGFKHLGIADDVYPTDDGLPFIPYYRESRRIKGMVQFTINDLARPFEQTTALYRTGIAVGDYPVDHHHQAYPEAESLPELHFYPVPSYSLPLGTLIPKGTDHFVVAEKSISVTNIVNGTTRLQPVCILIGQASGVLAALAVQNNTTPAKVKVRKVQNALLDAGAYLMPYSDVEKGSVAFQSLQRIGATGILKGEGKNIGWENHTYIYPDSLMTRTDLAEGLTGWINQDQLKVESEFVSYQECLELIKVLGKQFHQACGKKRLSRLEKEAGKILEANTIVVPELHVPVNRAIFAILLDQLLDPFEIRQVDHQGQFID
ncbi:MAG: FAD-dependent oxidoreductase [Labilibaculum sp.]|nr:FAD-dependent oxidoreductase [Labilibaculum sp.]